jgi:molybdopterin-guanine dinucleotide biosynthesis protein A
VIPRRNGVIEPLVAFYPKSAHPIAEALLSNSQNAAANIARQCVQSGLAEFAETSAADAKFFTNWNAPIDLLPSNHSRISARPGSRTKSHPAALKNFKPDHIPGQKIR